MRKNKYQDVSPKDLTIGEILDILTDIAKYEYNKRSDIQQWQDYGDIAQEVITYMLEKQSRGKTGLKDLQEKCTMDHFINILHLECRNNINYIIRKKSTQRYLYNTDLLSTPAGVAEDKSGPNKELADIIPDTKYLSEIETKLELQDIISDIGNIEDNSIVIKYGEGTNECIFKFSYKNLTKLYFELYSNKKITYKDLSEFLYDKETNTKLDSHKIKDIVTKFRNYILDNKILGGINL
jgi:hypothetical protein